MSRESMLAYAAGFFDGEGSAFLVRIHHNDGRPSVAYRIGANATNCDREVLDWLQSEFGGSVRVKRANHTVHRDAYDWRITGQAAVSFFEATLPYLRIKRRRAELLLYFNTLPKRPGRIPVSAEDAAERERVWEEMAALNRRGKPVPDAADA